MESNDLKSLPLFEGLTDEAATACSRKFQETEMLAATVLAQEGEFADKFFVELEGELEVQRDVEHVATLGAGDSFGEMGVIEHGRRNARVVARTRCRLAWMLGWDFEQTTKDHPDVAARVHAALEARSESSADG